MNPIRTEHALSPKDASTVQAIRQQSAPFKGMMTGPGARPGYDAIIEAVPQAEAVSYEEAVLGGVAGKWCRPPSARGDAAILYLHGGGYMMGSARAYRHFAGQFAARTGFAAFVPDYPLAPERPFPAAVDAAQAAWRGLLAQGMSAIALVGDSAGGGLALVTLAALQAEATAGRAPALRCCVAMSPWTDLALTGASLVTRADEELYLSKAMLQACARHYLGAGDRRAPAASPLYGAFGGLPPTQLHVGTSEVLLDDALRYAERAQAQGGNAEVHVWQGMPHVFPSSIGALDAAEEAMTIMAGFVRKHLRS